MGGYRILSEWPAQSSQWCWLCWRFISVHRRFSTEQLCGLLHWQASAAVHLRYGSHLKGDLPCNKDWFSIQQSLIPKSLDETLSLIQFRGLIAKCRLFIEYETCPIHLNGWIP